MEFAVSRQGRFLGPFQIFFRAPGDDSYAVAQNTLKYVENPR